MRPLVPAQAPAAPRNKVTFGPFAVVKGALVSFLFFALGSLALALPIAPVTEAGASEVNRFGIWLMIVAGAFAGTLFVAVPLAVGLGLLLRRVARQSLHVAAFFMLFGLLAMLPFVLAFEPGDTAMVLLVGLGAGSLAAIGRLSVIRNVYLTTTPEPAHAR